MPWPPFHTLDLIEQGMLPDRWEETVLALTNAPERQRIIAKKASLISSAWQFDVVEGHVIRERLGWFWSLYHGALIDFSTRSIGYPLQASRRLRAATTLNILAGAGASNEWHSDANAVTGVLFARAPDAGGEPEFRDGAGREVRLAPRPGTFVCFEGAVEHRVAPLGSPEALRLALLMVYHREGADQPPAYGPDVYLCPGEGRASHRARI